MPVENWLVGWFFSKLLTSKQPGLHSMTINRDRESLAANSPKLVVIYSGLPRLIAENFKSIAILAKQDYVLCSYFTLWESLESEKCALFLARSGLPFHVNLVPQPPLKELAELYEIPYYLLSELPENHTRLLNQYQGTKLAYLAAKRHSAAVLGVQHPFCLRSRTDLYVDRVFAKSIKLQLNVQLNHEVAFSAAAFGSGFVDSLWLSGPHSSDTMFSMVDGLAELWAIEYFFQTEVLLKLYADKHRISYLINRRLPCGRVGTKNGKLYIRDSVSRQRRNIALLAPNYRVGQGTTRACYQSVSASILEGIKGLPADLRFRYRLFRCNRSRSYWAS